MWGLVIHLPVPDGWEAMRLRAGTSGYQYKAWRGDFYPERCREADMLEHYAARLPTVEMNNTFYRMPRREVMARWAERVPAQFRFAIKAPQRITHRLRLKDCEEAVGFLFEGLGALGSRLGPVLFQLPPNFKQDLGRLSGLLASVPPGVACACEFRHPSWHDEPVHALLRAHGAALCLADTDADARLLAAPERAWPVTADFGYLRLRRDNYSAAALAAIAARLRAQPWDEAFVYLKHEQAAPALAQDLAAAFDSPA